MRSRPVDVHKHVRRRRKRADAVGNGGDPHTLLTDFGLRAQPRNAEPVEVGAINGDRVRSGERFDTALDQIPRLEPARAQIRADHEDRR